LVGRSVQLDPLFFVDADKASVRERSFAGGAAAPAHAFSAVLCHHASRRTYSTGYPSILFAFLEFA
jgi:hypothetical protein